MSCEPTSAAEGFEPGPEILEEGLGGGELARALGTGRTQGSEVLAVEGEADEAGSNQHSNGELQSPEPRSLSR